MPRFSEAGLFFATVCPMTPLLRVEQLQVSFPATEKGKSLTVVRDVSFEIRAGEFVALVGESGCGKSISALSLARLPPTDQAIVTGRIIFNGTDLLSLKRSGLRRLRGAGIAYVFQDPASSLNPVLRIGEQLREALPEGTSRAGGHSTLLDLLHRVRLPQPEKILRAWPHELSGGMQQRVMVAMAVAANPQLLIADEPTTALDVTTQQHVLTLLDELRQDMNMGLLLVTHNLGLVARYADRVAVMYAGQVVETGPVGEILTRPAHHYTAGLLRAVPRLDSESIESLQGIPGRVPHPSQWPGGCAFAARCPAADESCRLAQTLPLIQQQNRNIRCLHPLTSATAD